MPAAFTLISTWVPVGSGVGWSTSFRGALNSATWKLFMLALPNSCCCRGHCHVCRRETNHGAPISHHFVFERNGHRFVRRRPSKQEPSCERSGGCPFGPDREL